MDNTVTVLSMNVKGLFSSVKKRNDVFDWAKGKNTSIVCFQETHSSKEVEKLWEDEWGNTCLFSHSLTFIERTVTVLSISKI
jgi:exonuclease III